MSRKEQGNVVIASIFVGALFLSLIYGGWYLFRWLGENNSPPKANSVSIPVRTTAKHSKAETIPERREHIELTARLQSQQDNLDLSIIDQAQNAGFSLHEIGSTQWTDEEYDKLVSLLRENPQIRQHVALAFRINTNAKKAKRLAILLGQFDDQIITDVGQELAFSGDVASQKNGLALLAKQQPHNENARGVVLEILQLESSPEVLVSALNAVAIPPSDTVVEQKALLDQFTRLSDNPDPKVRSHSMSMMTRWAGDENVNEYLLKGVNDSDPQVRRTATFSLIKTRHLTDTVKIQLLERALDPTENKRTREASLMGLERYDLSDEERQSLSSIRKSLY